MPWSAGLLWWQDGEGVTLAQTGQVGPCLARRKLREQLENKEFHAWQLWRMEGTEVK